VGDEQPRIDPVHVGRRVRVALAENVEALGPTRMTVRVRQGDVVDVEVVIALVGDRYVVQAVRGENLTGEVLHALRPPEIIREAVLGEMMKAKREWGAVSLVWEALRGDRVRVPAEDRVAFVAMAYRAAYLVGLPPTATVTAALGLPRSSVGRLIREARDQGLLGPTEARRAGV
jgi:hypothetical protein